MFREGLGLRGFHRAPFEPRPFERSQARVIRPGKPNLVRRHSPRLFRSFSIARACAPRALSGVVLKASPIRRQLSPYARSFTTCSWRSVRTCSAVARTGSEHRARPSTVGIPCGPADVVRTPFLAHGLLTKELIRAVTEASRLAAESGESPANPIFPATGRYGSSCTQKNVHFSSVTGKPPATSGAWRL
jgi:hypothetical protein